jgi:hypothetical protein
VTQHPSEWIDEVRSVSSTGGEKGVKPQAVSLVPMLSVLEISEVYTFGAKKYAAHNWRRGYEWSKSYDAVERHLAQWWEGEDLDPESGLCHLAHAGFHVFTLLDFRKNHPDFDDRYKP